MDIEYPHKLTEEEKRAIEKAWKACIPKKPIIIGSPIIFGTMGHVDFSENYFRKLWTEGNF